MTEQPGAVLTAFAALENAESVAAKSADTCFRIIFLDIVLHIVTGAHSWVGKLLRQPATCNSAEQNEASVAAAFIDFEHMILPDQITIGGTILGVATASFRDMTFIDSLLGAGVGFAIVFLPFVVIYPLIRGGAGMGLGDAKLLMLAGAWFGWIGAIVVLCAGAVQGTLAAIGTMVLQGKIEEPEAVRKEREELRAELEKLSPEERAEAEKELAKDPLMEEAGEGLGQARMAFGPFLVLATIEFLFFGRQFIEVYVSWISADS